MVVSLGPGHFYGSSLPRPRMMLMKISAAEEDIYMKERVDPPLGVMDPLLSWAHEAHWSMGGLSFNRLQLQGKIEGNVKKLRSQQKKKLLAIKNKLSDPVVEEDEDVAGINRELKRARKLVDDFDRVASSESESSLNTIRSSPSSLVKSTNTKKNQSRTISSRTRSACNISPEKEEVEVETTPATTTSAGKKVQYVSKPVLRSKSKANDVAGDARK